MKIHLLAAALFATIVACSSGDAPSSSAAVGSETTTSKAVNAKSANKDKRPIRANQTRSVDHCEEKCRADAAPNALNCKRIGAKDKQECIEKLKVGAYVCIQTQCGEIEPTKQDPKMQNMKKRAPKARTFDTPAVGLSKDNDCATAC